MPSIIAWLHLILTHYICSSTQTMSRNFRRFEEFDESRFGSSEKDRYVLKILKWQYKLIQDYKREKLVSNFLNNDAKTCLYGLNISKNIEIEHVFKSKVFFRLSGFSASVSTQVSSVPWLRGFWKLWIHQQI